MVVSSRPLVELELLFRTVGRAEKLRVLFFELQIKLVSTGNSRRERSDFAESNSNYHANMTIDVP